MKEIVDLIGGESTLTITNIILAGCIIFHLICEFAHYIHEFWSHRKDGKQVKANGEVLKEVRDLLERVEKTQKERGEHKCKCSDKRKKEDSHEKMDDSSSRPL